ncbi:MAG TPA: class I SAM-dependent RNA methyltransferase [Anaerolineales bacterium]|jgi:23S rRNA (uracil1939-C5)-methyltransferase|nr:class I SAM-dependent RNA methyltransferase [Anaerolineales bacterium]
MGAERVFEVELSTFTYGGEVLGRLPDGKAVFVPFALPGERVRVGLVEEKQRYARAELLAVLEAAPQRTAPLCAHFGVCGGCHYQHMPYQKQLEAKAEILRDQLQRIGRISDPPVRATVASPRAYYYRNHIQFHLTETGRLGFHEALSKRVFAVQECHLPVESINEVWPRLDVEPIPGLQRVNLRSGVDEDVLVVLESEEALLPESSVEELPVSVAHLGPAGTQVLAGSDHIIIEVLGRPFRVSAGSFFQVNTPMAEKLAEHVLTYLSLEPKDTVLDIYAGVGLFSAFLAPKVERLVAIEAASTACDDFVVNLDEFYNVDLYEGTAEAIVPILAIQPRLIVVDPPRSGIDKIALDGILKLGPEVLAYVSCDPATLGRDARRLTAGGYRLVQATPFDLFPQTYHIESVSFWKRVQ